MSGLNGGADAWRLFPGYVIAACGKAFVKDLGGSSH